MFSSFFGSAFVAIVHAVCIRTVRNVCAAQHKRFIFSILLPNPVDYSRTFGLNLDAFVPFCFALRGGAECSALIKIEENYFLLQCGDISLCYRILSCGMWVNGK